MTLGGHTREIKKDGLAEDGLAPAQQQLRLNSAFSSALCSNRVPTDRITASLQATDRTMSGWGWPRRPRLARLEASQPYSQLDSPTCRVCWSEAELGQGGALLTPCACRGSSQFIHYRCLERWLDVALEQHGPDEYLTCQTCLQRYRLPPSLRRGEPAAPAAPAAPSFGQRVDALRQSFHHAVGVAFKGCLEGPFGWFFSTLLNGATITAGVTGYYAAIDAAHEATHALRRSLSRPLDAGPAELRRLGTLAALHSLCTSEGLG